MFANIYTCFLPQIVFSATFHNRGRWPWPLRGPDQVHGHFMQPWPFICHGHFMQPWPLCRLLRIPVFHYGHHWHVTNNFCTNNFYCKCTLSQSLTPLLTLCHRSRHGMILMNCFSVFFTEFLPKFQSLVLKTSYLHMTNAQANAKFKRLMNSIFYDHLPIFTDGSKISFPAPSVSAAMIIPNANYEGKYETFYKYNCSWSRAIFI